MNVEVLKLTDEQLRILIKNHRTKGATLPPRYIEALGELARRQGHGLNFETTMRIVQSAARRREFLIYKELADASGVDWNKAHYAINDHLWQLVEYAHRRGWPRLSAIIVNKSNVGMGDTEPSTLKAAHDLGYAITDEHAFLPGTVSARIRVGRGSTARQIAFQGAAWQTASMLFPSGSKTKAP